MLQSDVEVEQFGEIYRLHQDDVHGFYLQKKMDQEWHPLYTFKIEPALPIDMDMANFYTSTSPQHIFRDAIIGTRMTSQGRVTLSDHTFRIFDLTKGTLEKETITDFVAYLGRSNTAVVSPLATTSSRPTTSRSCSWHPSAYGCAFNEFTICLTANLKEVSSHSKHLRAVPIRSIRSCIWSWRLPQLLSQGPSQRMPRTTPMRSPHHLRPSRPALLPGAQEIRS